jgi:hypothetical protein
VRLIGQFCTLQPVDIEGTDAKQIRRLHVRVLNAEQLRFVIC